MRFKIVAAVFLSGEAAVFYCDCCWEILSDGGGVCLRLGRAAGCRPVCLRPLERLYESTGEVIETLFFSYAPEWTVPLPLVRIGERTGGGILRARRYLLSDGWLCLVQRDEGGSEWVFEWRLTGQENGESEPPTDDGASGLSVRSPLH
jgi:hypothetical protein